MNITKSCNLACKYCWADSRTNSSVNIPNERAVEIVKTILKSHRIERIHFMGGEPTLNFKAIEDVVSYFINSSTNVMPVFYITTNGVIPKEKLSWLIDKRFAFSISWDGLEHAHDSQRSLKNKKPSEEVVRRSILRVSGDKSLLLRVRMTISSLNLPYLYDSVEWLAKNGIKFIHIEPMSQNGRNSKFVQQYSPDPEKFINEFFRVVELAEKRGIWLMNSTLANLYTPRDYYCASLREQSFNINTDGSVSHCYKVQDKNDILSDCFIVGNCSDSGREVFIDKMKSYNLANLNISDFPMLKNHYLRFIHSGGCPYRNILIKNSFCNTNLSFIKFNNSLLRKAILHIYENALKKKRTALEGYIYFYAELNRVNKKFEKVKENEKAMPEINKKQRDIHPFDIISIPFNHLDRFGGIDACDICI